MATKIERRTTITYADIGRGSVRSSGTISARNACAIHFLNSCHQLILERLQPAKSLIFRTVTPLTGESKLDTTTQCVALKLLGNREEGQDETGYKPKTLTKDFNVSFEKKRAVAAGDNPRNIITNSPEFLQAMTKNFKDVPSLWRLIKLLLQEDNAVLWNTSIGPENVLPKLSKQSKRHRKIASFLFYLNMVARSGTGITKTSATHARSQSNAAFCINGVLSLTKGHGNITLSAAHHTILADSVDDYPLILEQRLLDQFNKVKDVLLTKPSQEVIETTSKLILELVALGVSFEEAEDLFYQVSLNHLTPEDAIDKIKKHLLKDFYLKIKVPLINAPSKHEIFHEGSSISYKSPLYYLNQQTALAPLIVNTVDCVLERASIWFEHPKFPRQNLNSRELTTQLYTQAGNKSISPKDALEIHNAFLIQLIKTEQTHLLKILDTHEKLKLNIEKLMAINLLDTSIGVRTHLTSLKAELKNIENYIDIIQKTVSELHESIQPKKAESFPTMLMTNLFDTRVMNIKTWASENIKAIDEALKLLDIPKSSKELKAALATELNLCRAEKDGYLKQKKELKDRIAAMKKSKALQSTASLSSGLTKWDGDIGRVDKRINDLETLSLDFNNITKDPAITAARVRKLIPTFKEGSPIECVIAFMRNPETADLKETKVWKSWTDTRISGTTQVHKFLTSSINACERGLKIPITNLNTVFEAQKQGLLQVADDVAEGYFAAEDDEELATLGEALRAHSIPLQDTPILR